MKKMRLFNLEFRKSVLIIILFLLSLFQMGILWSEKSSGIPFAFSDLAFWRSSGPVELSEIKTEYYQPGSILVSEGKGDLYWPLSSEDNAYRLIWKDLRDSYFSHIIQKKPDSGEKSYEQDWDALTKMKTIIFEFKSPVPSGIIRWMAGIDSSVVPVVKQIYKIAIFPLEDINENKITLYVYDGKAVYKYVATIDPENMKKEDYVKVIDTVRSKDNIIPLNRLTDYFAMTENRDILISLSDKKKKIWDLLVKTPESIMLKKDNIDNIKDHLVDEYKKSMVTDLANDETSVIFSNEEQVYRYYFNGLLYYQYRDKGTENKGLVEEALEKALMFIETRKKDLIDGVELHLSHIKPEEDNYVFIFDYVINGMEIKIVKHSDKTIHPAIEIRANRDRVLDVKWYLKTFTHNDYYSEYKLTFHDFFEQRAIVEYPQLRNSMIQNISQGYLLPENGMRAEPYWWIETDSQLVYLRMQGEGG